MPTNTTGDPTVAEAPDAAPDPENFPIIESPNDLETLDADSIYQRAVALANHVAFLKLPFAKASSWAQKIKRFRNARLQDRFAVDHMGYPGGRIVSWQEWWRGNDTQLATGSSTFEKTVAFWSAAVTTTGGGITINNPTDARAILSRVALLAVGTNGSESEQLTSQTQGRFTADNGPAVDIDVYPEVASTGQVAYTFGLGQRFADDTALIGGVFEKKSTDTNWFAVCGDGTTLSTRVDTGVAVGAAAWNKLRVEWHGANVADNSTAAMRFYIADVLVATITSNLPTGAATPSVNAVLGAKRASGSTVTSCYLGPVRFSQNY